VLPGESKHETTNPRFLASHGGGGKLVRLEQESHIFGNKVGCNQPESLQYETPMEGRGHSISARPASKKKTEAVKSRTAKTGSDMREGAFLTWGEGGGPGSCVFGKRRTSYRRGSADQRRTVRTLRSEKSARLHGRTAVESGQKRTRKRPTSEGDLLLQWQRSDYKKRGTGKKLARYSQATKAWEKNPDGGRARCFRP